MAIPIKIRIGLLYSVLHTLFFSTACAQSVPTRDTGYIRPPVTSSLQDLRRQLRNDPTKELIELKQQIPDLVYDLRYATTRNFMHQSMYPEDTRVTFLRAPAATALRKVQDTLRQLGLGIKVFDAYRPYDVTVRFWDLVRDARFVAHPAKGSGHNRGIAVDLTLIQRGSGAELPMGTGFDDFSDTAHQDFTALPEDVLQNRHLLRSTMERYGFIAYADEWWHYSWPEPSRFELLDISFRKLKRIKAK
ncbi:MAG: hypothetical protein RJA57_276 [Bacteroidota bacterium]|jgi:D-alanyl-D-alanine dipeptidase